MFMLICILKELGKRCGLNYINFIVVFNKVLNRFTKIERCYIELGFGVLFKRNTPPMQGYKNTYIQWAIGFSFTIHLELDIGLNSQDKYKNSK